MLTAKIMIILLSYKYMCVCVRARGRVAIKNRRLVQIIILFIYSFLSSSIFFFFLLDRITHLDIPVSARTESVVHIVKSSLYHPTLAIQVHASTVRRAHGPALIRSAVSVLRTTSSEQLAKESH